MDAGSPVPRSVIDSNLMVWSILRKVCTLAWLTGASPKRQPPGPLSIPIFASGVSMTIRPTSSNSKKESLLLTTSCFVQSNGSSTFCAGALPIATTCID